MQITENDFQNWWNNPVGAEVKAMLKERMEMIAHKMADGACMGTIGTSPEYYGELVGRYKEIKDLIDMNFKELMGV